MPNSAMKRLLPALALLPLTLWGIFALPAVLAAATGFWDWRKALIVLSGILALWWMSAGMLLAARPAWLEAKAGGLDRLYRLHKQLGIGAGLLVLAHWLLEWAPKKLAKLGWLARPGGGPRGPRPPPDFWIGLAHEVGEWAGYILLGLVLVALLRRIPYRFFRWAHKAFGLVFLAGAFHGLMLLPGTFWQQPLGWLTALLAAAGIAPALLSLAGRIGRRRRHPARIETLRAHPDGILEVVCRPAAGWPGHLSGQFVLADFGHRGEGAHPFTIASAWDAERGTLTLAIKALGDYTRQLKDCLRPGQPLDLEGPYGGFIFAGDGAQVWIAGGVGITPFLARLDELARKGASPHATIDFFHSTRGGGFPANLDELCAAAGVRLHRRSSDREGTFDPAEIAASLTAGASVWFCGPAAWGEELAARLGAAGLPPPAFHREAFEFR